MPTLKARHASEARERGFSLIEVIVALLIMSTLAGIVGINVRQAVQSARIDAAQDTVSQIVRTTRAQSTFLGEPVLFERARRAHPHERGGQTIWFEDNASADRDGICLPTSGEIRLGGEIRRFTVAYYTCEITYAA
jgi:prepilin-type N-terminal cleavage/methylation domain-containing protein